MCCFSMCGQIVYGLLMVACIILTATSMFTSSWGDFKDMSGSSHNMGIMPWTCVKSSGGQDCKTWWKDSHTWLKVVSIMMCLALALEILALAWNVITFFACCCKKYIIHPLSIFAFFITAFLLTAVIIYAVNNKDLTKQTPTISNAVGWSFWVACCALAAAAADVIVGAVTVCLGESNL